ncbi:MAG: CehA/McbA family metallohydrolase [Anaerolineaceae bacterium]
MNELVANLHIHTTYSDGSGSHDEIAREALDAGLDAIIVTDHNILVNGLDGYRQNGSRRLLMLVGEEIHDQVRNPQKNHLLVIGANQELATFAPNPQVLLDKVNQTGGLSFLAHPVDPAMPAFSEPDISWEDWDIHSFTGLELWNQFSELKNVSHGYLDALFFAFFPQFIAHGPLPATLKIWDEQLRKGRRVVAVGGSDSHALKKHLGPIHRTIFPYSFHFHGVNNHLMTEQELTGDLPVDRRMILDAFRLGNLFIGYDYPASTRGFRFIANGKGRSVSMGDEIDLAGGVTFQIKMPEAADCRLMKDGILFKRWENQEFCTQMSTQPGVYRVECYLHYLGKRRGWIFSNPIYVRG